MLPKFYQESIYLIGSFLNGNVQLKVNINRMPSAPASFELKEILFIIHVNLDHHEKLESNQDMACLKCHLSEKGVPPAYWGLTIFCCTYDPSSTYKSFALLLIILMRPFTTWNIAIRSFYSGYFSSIPFTIIKSLTNLSHNQSIRSTWVLVVS